MPTVLILAASPLDQDRLRLGAEVKEIRHALQRSRNRENWRIESNEAATVDDLRRALLDHRPTVVHFAGHGGGPSGLCFEDQNGLTHATDALPLAKLFHHFRDELKCVVLNACFSEQQAEIIKGEIDYVIGMNSSIEDGAATKFAVALYDALFAGTDFRAAFDLACTTLALHNLPDTNVPVILFGDAANKQKLLYNAQVPDLERFLLAYLNTPYLERAQFTTTGPAIRPMLQRYYGDKMHVLVNAVKVIALQPLADDVWRVAVNVRRTGGKDYTSDYYCNIRNRNILLEWEASVGLRSVPVRTFLALGGKSVVARVEAEIDDYYNYAFGGHEDAFQSVKMRTADGQGLHGYVRRRTALHDELLEMLRDGREHRITVEVAAVGESNTCCLITNMLSKSWIYDETAKAQNAS